MEFFELGVDLCVVSLIGCSGGKKTTGGAQSGTSPNSSKVCPSNPTDLYQDPIPPPPYKYTSPVGRLLNISRISAHIVSLIINYVVIY